jgi:predicted small lipoprotein YifL
MTKIISILLISALFVLAGCGKGGDNQPNEDQKNNSEEKTGIKSLDDFVDNMKEVQKGFEEGKKYEVVDFRDLKALLPESIGDMSRSNAEGEKSGAMGFTVSKAEADYNNEDYSKNIGIEITDFTGAAGFSGLAAWGWAMAEVDKETETGYEKTIKYKGHKAFEKYDNQGHYGSIEVLVSGRFIVSVNGNNVLMDEIKSALDQIDIGKLESMKEANPVSE